MDLENVEASQPWRVYHSEQDESPQGRAELANACSNLFGAALGQYFTDCASALRGKAAHGDKGEALEDLTSADMPLLRHLCRQCGANVDRVAAGMIAGLDAGKRFTQGAMNRHVPERAEEYGTWQSNTRGKTTTPWRETGGGIGALSGRVQ